MANNKQIKTAKDTLLVCLILMGIMFSDYIFDLVAKYIF